MKLRVPDDVVQRVKKIHPDIKRKIRAALEIIGEGPYTGKNLKGELAGLKSFRVGHFRVIYRLLHTRSIEIVAVGPRMTIYQETHRKIYQS